MNLLIKGFLCLTICSSANIFSQSFSIKNQSFKIGEKKSIALAKVNGMNCSMIWTPDNSNLGFIEDSNSNVIGSIAFSESNKLIGISKDWDSIINYNNITTLFDAIYVVSKKAFGNYSDIAITIEELTEPHAKYKSIELSKFNIDNSVMVKDVVSISLINDNQLHVNQRLNLVE